MTIPRDNKITGIIKQLKIICEDKAKQELKIIILVGEYYIRKKQLKLPHRSIDIMFDINCIINKDTEFYLSVTHFADKMNPEIIDQCEEHVTYGTDGCKRIGLTPRKILLLSKRTNTDKELFSALEVAQDRRWTEYQCRKYGIINIKPNKRNNKNCSVKLHTKKTQDLPIEMIVSLITHTKTQILNDFDYYNELRASIGWKVQTIKQFLGEIEQK